MITAMTITMTTMITAMMITMTTMITATMITMATPTTRITSGLMFVDSFRFDMPRMTA